MYSDNSVHVDTLQNNFQQYCLETDNWVLLIGDRFEITDNEVDRITRNELARLHNNNIMQMLVMIQQEKKEKE